MITGAARMDGAILVVSRSWTASGCRRPVVPLSRVGPSGRRLAHIALSLSEQAPYDDDEEPPEPVVGDGDPRAAGAPNTASRDEISDSFAASS